MGLEMWSKEEVILLIYSSYTLCGFSVFVCIQFKLDGLLYCLEGVLGGKIERRNKKKHTVEPLIGRADSILGK